jgi:hypothetical protein
MTRRFLVHLEGTLHTLVMLPQKEEALSDYIMVLI